MGLPGLLQCTQMPKGMAALEEAVEDQKGYRVEDSDEPWDKEEEIQKDMVPGAESISILELDALIKMPMPEEDPEEEAEKELQQQVMVRMRAYKWSKSEEVESEVEMYEDLEPVLVQEVELEGDKEKEKERGDVDMVGLSGTDTS